MEKNIKIIFALGAVALIGLIAGLVVTFNNLKLTTAERDTALSERDTARLFEGLGLLHRAEAADHRYPDTVLYAAKAIGFVGQGLEESENAEVIPFIRKSQNPEAFAKAESWIAERQGYGPVWAQDLGESVTDISISPNGRYLFTSSHSSSKRWDFAKDGTALEIKGGGTIAEHPDGEQFAFIDNQEVVVQKGADEIARYQVPVTTICYNAVGDYLAGAKEDGTIVIIDAKAKVLGKAPGGIGQLAFSPDDSSLAAVVPNLGVRLWFHHDKSEHPIWKEHESLASSLAYHPDPMAGKILIGNTDGSIAMWRIFDGAKLASIDPVNQHEGPVTSLAFQSDGKRFVSAGADGTIKLWNLEDNQPQFVATLSGHNAQIHDVAFFPGEALIASCGADSRVKIWDIREDSAPENLYRFFKNDWYSVDESSRNLNWAKGSGFMALPSDTIIDAWQTDNQSLVSSLTARTKDSMSEAIKTAIENKNWSLANLYSRKTKLLGSKAEPIAPLVSKGKNFTSGSGVDMIWCKPGNYFMGESDGPDFAKRHKVKLTSGFWLGKTEVTQGLFEQIMGNNPSANREGGGDTPADSLSWFDAEQFCIRLTALERANGSIPAGWRYALPTEAQWEYACRAGTESTWSFGDDEKKLHQFGNFDDKQGNFSEDTDPTQDDGHKLAANVGSYKANAWGFHDMHGNLFEWCRDAMDANNPNYPEGDVIIDQESTEGPLRVIRGGGFDGTAAECRSAYRDANQPLIPSKNLGMRVALVPPKK